MISMFSLFSNINMGQLGSSTIEDPTIEDPRVTIEPLNDFRGSIVTLILTHFSFGNVASQENYHLSIHQ